MPHSDPKKIQKQNSNSNSVYLTKYKTSKDVGLETYLYGNHNTMSTQTNFNSSTTVNLSQQPNKVQVYRETQTQTSRTVISLDRPRSSRGDYSPDSLSPRFDNYTAASSPRSNFDNCSLPLNSCPNPRRKAADLTPQLSQRDQESAAEGKPTNSNDVGCVESERVQIVASPRRMLVCQRVSAGDTREQKRCCGDDFKSQPNGSSLNNVPSHKRKQVLNYLNLCESCHQCEMCERKQKELLAGNMLMKTFLEKNRDKTKVSSYSDRNFYADRLRSRSYVEETQVSAQLQGKTGIPVASIAMRNLNEKFGKARQCVVKLLANEHKRYATWWH